MKPKSRNRQRKAAEQLVSSYNLSYQLALQVVREQIDLTSAIKQNKTDNQIEFLIKQHELHRSLAVQIVRGELDEVETINKVYGKRMLKENALSSIWRKAMESESNLHLYCHQKEQHNVQLSTVSQYSIVCSDGQEIPKLNVKAAHVFSESVGFEQLDVMACPPIERPEKRFRISNSRLYGLHKSNATLSFRLLEGLVFTGKLTWFNNWELAVESEQGHLSIFRHALVHVKGEA